MTHADELRAYRRDEILDLVLGQEVRVFLRQLQQQRLRALEYLRYLPNEPRDLAHQHRQQPEQQQCDERDETQEHAEHADEVRHAEPLQPRHQPLQQVGDHDRRQHRRQHAAEEIDGKRYADQRQRQRHDLRIGYLVAKPARDAIHLHSSSAFDVVEAVAANQLLDLAHVGHAALGVT